VKSLWALLTIMFMVLCAVPLLEGTSITSEKTQLGVGSDSGVTTVNAASGYYTYKWVKKGKRWYKVRVFVSYKKATGYYVYKWVKKGKRWYKVKVFVRYVSKAPVSPAPTTTPTAPRVTPVPEPEQYKSTMPYDLNDTNKTSDKDWKLLNPDVAYDPQDTSYTCGPASLKMALAEYGVNVDESWLAYTAWTSSSSGTSHDGLINAVASVNQRFGTSLSAWDESFISWERLEGNYLSQNKPVILHIRSFINSDGGHYVLLKGINTMQQTVVLADPSYGSSDHYVSFAEMQSRMEWIILTGRSSQTVIPIVNT